MLMRENTYLQNVKNFLYNELLIQEKEVRDVRQKNLVFEQTMDEDLSEKLEVVLTRFRRPLRERFILIISV